MSTQIPFKRFKYFLNPRGLGDEELQNAPEDWEQTQITYTRSEKYSGLVRGFTDSIKFVQRAAFICRREFYQFLLTANVQFIAQRQFNFMQFKQLFNGKLDFSSFQDNLTNVTINAVPNDFSQNIDAYDSVSYAIPLNVDEAINLELPPLALNEQATLLPFAPPDGHIHSDYFPPITIVNNQQNSINPSVQAVTYRQFRSPDFSTETGWFFTARVSGKLQITGSLTLKLNTIIDGDPHHLKLSMYNQSGVIVFPVYDAIVTNAGGITVNTTLNGIIDVTQGDFLFLYMEQVEDETENTGIAVTGGEIDLSYKTITPATMTKALRASDLFAAMLKAMNVNTDSGPKLPVPNQSFLLTGPLKQLVITCSDSIRAAEGSIYHAGDQMFIGVYKVVSGTITYNSISYSTGNVFSFVTGQETFTGSGVVQKTQSISVGNVYNAGDTLQAGGTYLVEGNTGEHAIYNGASVSVGQIFKYVLGQTTFSVSDDTVFVKQIAEDPQIILTFADFFQSILAIQGGDCAFGLENGIAFIETLGYVYRSGINQLSLGITDATTKFEPATDLMGNSIKAGYEDQQYDALNGAQEVNSEQNYSTFLKYPAKEINLQSIIRADPYGIETARITQTDSAASRSDNDNFFAWVKSEPESDVPFTYYHPLRQEGLTSITGVDPSYYNWFISPKQNLLRGGTYLSSIFYNMQGYQISLSSAVKNSAMVTIDLTGRRVAEAEPINISDLPKPYFIPIYATVKAGLAFDALDKLDASPYGDLNFDYNGNNFKAFINKFIVVVGNDKPEELKLLLSPSNNLLKLVRAISDPTTD